MMKKCPICHRELGERTGEFIGGERDGKKFKDYFCYDHGKLESCECDDCTVAGDDETQK